MAEYHAGPSVSWSGPRIVVSRHMVETDRSHVIFRGFGKGLRPRWTYATRPSTTVLHDRVRNVIYMHPEIAQLLGAELERRATGHIEQRAQVAFFGVGG